MKHKSYFGEDVSGFCSLWQEFTFLQDSKHKERERNRACIRPVVDQKTKADDRFSPPHSLLQAIDYNHRKTGKQHYDKDSIVTLLKLLF